MNEIDRARGYKIAICIGLIAASLALISYTPSQTASLKGEVEAVADLAVAASAKQVLAPKLAAGSDEFSGMSLKGNRFRVKKEDVFTQGIITRAKVSWLNLDGRTNQTVKGFQCGKDLHSTLYRSDKPTKFDANRLDWHKVELRGATREIYDWSCNANSEGLLAKESAVSAADKAGDAADKLARSGNYKSSASSDVEELEDLIRELEDDLLNAEQRAYASEQRADNAEIELRYK